ncbi:hypothetical protein JS510_01265 [Mycoplasma tauri]|uniref:hypothetical protein n=1 Tax=Mycoplasma tauri TaxID=547987 RepID=UPI001967A78D|nr:hypothetical protein [Mycoplasma tauri]QSB07734.1 hypothetical protein JS510_01265 [Mycoplasma tauri]
MKFKNGQLNKKLNISNIEVKRSNDIVSDVKLYFPIEILKFLVLSFITVFFILLQYNNPISKNIGSIDVLRIVYLYSFGLAFGDLMILILIGCYLTLSIKWASPWFKKHYFKWFKPYQKVDYWTVRRSIIIFIWLNLLSIAIIYHSILVFIRLDMSRTFISVNQIGDIYTKGWFYSFTNHGSITKNNFSNELPSAQLNVGIYADSLFNLPYLLTFSPYLSWVIALSIMAFAWAKLIMINIKNYIKNMIPWKVTLPIIEKNVYKTSTPFYFTEQVAVLFDFYRKSANVLQIDIYKVKFSYLLKQINNNLTMLSSHNVLTKFFRVIERKRRWRSGGEGSDSFLNALLNNHKKFSSDADLLIAPVDPHTLLNDNKSKISFYKSNELTREINIKDFDTKIITAAYSKDEWDAKKFDKIGTTNEQIILSNSIFEKDIKENARPYESEKVANILDVYENNLQTNNEELTSQTNLSACQELDNLNTYNNNSNKLEISNIEKDELSTEINFSVDTGDIKIISEKPESNLLTINDDANEKLIKNNFDDHLSFALYTEEIPLEYHHEDDEDNQAKSNDININEKKEDKNFIENQKQTNFVFLYDTSVTEIKDEKANLKSNDYLNNNQNDDQLEWNSPILNDNK